MGVPEGSEPPEINLGGVSNILTTLSLLCYLICVIYCLKVTFY